MAFPINPSPGDTYTDEYGTVWVYAGSVNGWYRQTVIPGNNTTYTTGGGGGGSATAAGAAGEIQYTDGTNLAASADLSWDDTAKLLDVGGDITLDDGGTYTTTVQTITPTANRTISFPDAAGTVALVAGSNGQVAYNKAGAQAGLASANIGSTGEINVSLAGAASTPPVAFTGSWFTGGTATTTKPQLLIEPTGTTSTAWSTSGTGLGVNAVSGFSGRLLDLQTNGTSQMVVQGDGKVLVGTSSAREKFFNSASFPLQVQLETATTGARGLSIVNNSGADVSYGSYFVLGRSAGSAVNTYNAVSANYKIGAVSYQAADGTELVEAARIEAVVDGTPGANDMPGRLVFSTTADGASSPTERMRIKANGVINFASCPTYADDAAAGTGGLVAGDIYKTSTGELRIKL